MKQNRQSNTATRNQSPRPVQSTGANRFEWSRIGPWLGLAIPALLLVGVMLFGGGEPEQSGIGAAAPDFALSTTAQSVVTLENALDEGDALLYFSMGVGCDGCFVQIPEIEDRLAEMGINLVPVMVQPAGQVDTVARQFGIEGPILIDEDLAVSEAYDMLGVYGHSDRPSHSFALVSKDRTIKWVKHYATMFVPVDEFLADMPSA